MNNLFCAGKIGSEVWTLDLKNGSGSVSKGSSGKADCTMTMAEDVFEQLIAGKLNAQQAFMQGKLKVEPSHPHTKKKKRM